MYTEASKDKKLEYLNNDEFRVWFNLLCLAAEQENRGVIDGSDIFLLSLETSNGNEDLLLQTLEKLEKLKIIVRDEGEITFINFMKRQYDNPSDTPEEVRERVKRHRKKKNNDSETDVTPCNANVTTMKRQETDVTPREEKRREEEIRREEIRGEVEENPKTEKIDNQLLQLLPECPHKEIIEIHNEEVTDLPKVTLTPGREDALNLIWRENPESRFLDWWRKFFRKVQASDFLCGRVPGKDGNFFTVDFDWILKLDNFVRISEDKYKNRNSKKKEVLTGAAGAAATGFKERILPDD